MICASVGTVMSYIGYVFVAILVLLFMITVHELGHYVAGKIMGFGIEEFSIGFGPALFKKKLKNGEVFSIRLIPLGGYCAFLGETGENADPKAFNNKKPWQRIIVLISGAFMNYVTAVLIIIAMFGIYGQAYFVAYETEEPTSEYTQEVSLQKYDIILKAEGKDIYLASDLLKALDKKSEGDVVDFYIIRDGVKQHIDVKLRDDCDFINLEDTGKLYSSLGLKTDDGIRYTRIKLGFFKTIGRSFDYSVKLGGTIFTVLGQLITGKLGLSSVGGTVTTVSYMANAVKTGGFELLLEISGLIGVNLALFNLLPIPALDGAKVVFTVIEWIRKKPINRKVEAIISTIGFILLISFAVLVDVLQFIRR